MEIEMSKRLYLVELLTTFRNSYAIEASSQTEAEDLCVRGVSDGFSQLHIGDQPFRTREITEEEYLKIFDTDNDYLVNIPVERKLGYIVKATD